MSNEAATKETWDEKRPAFFYDVKKHRKDEADEYRNKDKNDPRNSNMP